MLCMIEADHRRSSRRAYADKVRPFLVKVVANKHVFLSRNLVDDGTKYGQIVKGSLVIVVWEHGA